ncbi:hypothetical protein HYDPIDRAFT_107101 [Hydnomerulius pinastri MD-312]|nr:hypothetical protein HYDPIDRAFT_107101 [Hydnomerulius pinastri MD-312]
MGTSLIQQEEISGFVGLAVALLMYGASLCQYYNYFRAFPQDRWVQKYLVLLVLIMSSLQIYSMIAIEWWYLVASHHASPLRAMPWELTSNLSLSIIIPFVVQSFYGHRLWIISERNKIITGLVWLLSFSQFLFGMISGFWKTPQSTVIELPFTGLYGFLGLACDLLITSSVYFYLRPGRSEVRRMETRVQQITAVTIHMGALTSTVALVTVLDWLIQHGHPTVLTPVMIIAQSYVNSILGVLNARKPRGKSDVPSSTIRLPTLPTIHVTGPMDSLGSSEAPDEHSGAV